MYATDVFIGRKKKDKLGKIMSNWIIREEEQRKKSCEILRNEKKKKIIYCV
jgi:hypothetical protein